MKFNLISLAALMVWTTSVVVGFHVILHGKAIRRSSALHSSTESKVKVVDSEVLDQQVQEHLQAVEKDLIDFFRTELGTNSHNPHVLQTWIRPSELLGASFVSAVGACLFTNDIWPVVFTAATANLMARQANFFGDFLRKIGGSTYFTLTGMFYELTRDNSSRTEQSLLTFDSYLHLVNNYRKITVETLLSTMQNSSLNLDTRMKNYQLIESFLTREKQLIAEAKAAEERQRQLLITQRAEFIKSLSHDLVNLSGSAQQSLAVKVEQMLTGAETLAAKAIRIGAGSIADFKAILSSTSNYTAVTLKDRYLHLAKEMHPDSQLTAGVDKALANSLMTNLTIAFHNLRGKNSQFVRRTDYIGAMEDQSIAAEAVKIAARAVNNHNQSNSNHQQYPPSHHQQQTAVTVSMAIRAKPPPPPPKTIREALSRGSSTDLRSLQQTQTAQVNAHASSPSFYSSMPSKQPLASVYLKSVNKRKELKDVHARVADIIASQKRPSSLSADQTHAGMGSNLISRSHTSSHQQQTHIATAAAAATTDSSAVSSATAVSLQPIEPAAEYQESSSSSTHIEQHKATVTHSSLSVSSSLSMAKTSQLHLKHPTSHSTPVTSPKLSPEKFAERKNIDWTQVRQRGSDIHSMMQQQEQLSLLSTVYHTKAVSGGYDSYRNQQQQQQGTRMPMSLASSKSNNNNKNHRDEEIKHAEQQTIAEHTTTSSDSSGSESDADKKRVAVGKINKAPSRLFSFLLGNTHTANNNTNTTSSSRSSVPNSTAAATAGHSEMKYTINTDFLFQTPTAATSSDKQHDSSKKKQDRLIRMGDRYVYEGEWKKQQTQQLQESSAVHMVGKE